MSSNNFSSSHPGLRLLVKHRLHEAVNIQAQNQQLGSPTHHIIESIHQVQPQTIHIREISVKLDINRTQLSYVSAIALPLEKPWSQPATEIAQKLIESLVQTTESSGFAASPSLLQPVWKCFVFDASSTGLITFKLLDQGLAKWLEILIYFFQNFKKLSCDMNDWDENPRIYLRDSTASPHLISKITQDRYLSRNSTDVLLIQYAHARCCSLLRLGMQEGLIQLADFPKGQSIVGSLPWLGENASLRCQHSSEYQLIRQICQNLDEISLVSNLSESERALKQASKLSQSFHRFYIDCPIFNEVKVKNMALAQVRLGLIDLVRSLLHLFLEDGLGIPAPSEL